MDVLEKHRLFRVIREEIDVNLDVENISVNFRSEYPYTCVYRINVI